MFKLNLNNYKFQIFCDQYKNELNQIFDNITERVKIRRCQSPIVLIIKTIITKTGRKQVNTGRFR